MAREFETLDLALRAWGKYDNAPFKLDTARAAHDRLVAILGPPPAPDKSGRLPYYIIDTNQYVGVRWQGVMELQCQAGFIQATHRLARDWILSPASTAASETRTWWRQPFPDHVTFDTAHDHVGSSRAMCPCSPGLLQPIGSRCERCEEVITRS